MVKPNENVPKIPPGEIGNVGYVCEHHKKSPDPHFTTLEPNWFLNRWCQLAFPFKTDKDKEGEETGREYMWVLCTALAETEGYELRGILNNDPIHAHPWKDGDWLEFNRDEILVVNPDDSVRK